MAVASAMTRSTISNLIKYRILMSGPIPVADYMRMALTAQPLTGNIIGNRRADSGGYYMKSDVFGKQGDFITSPEISQIFGEMLAVWGLQTWMQIGGPKKFSIVELGPGRGTLAKDILRVFKQFEHITGKDVSLHLVEISPYLASVQHASLTSSARQILKNKSHENAVQLQTTNELNAKTTQTTEGQDKVAENLPLLLDPFEGSTRTGNPYYHHAVASESGYPVYWYRDVNDLPKDFHFYIAHEFFDALPIHKLQKVDNGWKEVLIDINNPEQSHDGESRFRYVVSRNETPVIKLLKQNYAQVLQDSREHIEVSIDGMRILATLVEQLNACGGIASIIDYGHDGDKEDTFRAFYKHKLHDPLIDPGMADLTADVDFSTIRKLYNDQIMICGPLSQRQFFTNIGIEQRLNMLMKKSNNAKDKENLSSGYKMIMDDMGSRFKVMSLLPNILKSRMPNLRVAGF